VPQVVVAKAFRQFLNLLAGLTQCALDCPRGQLTAVFAGQEQLVMPIAGLGRDAVTCDSVSETVAVALLPALGQQVRDITITAVKLAVVFGTGVTLTVEPGERYESWQISSDDGLLVVCNPGGDLT
jgi:hypothetical protein